MKAEVKNIDYVWHAFMPTSEVLKSAGVIDIIEQVEENWPLAPGNRLEWVAKPGKFVVKEIEKPAEKMSKSEQ